MRRGGTGVRRRVQAGFKTVLLIRFKIILGLTFVPALFASIMDYFCISSLYPFRRRREARLEAARREKEEAAAALAARKAATQKRLAQQRKAKAAKAKKEAGARWC